MEHMLNPIMESLPSRPPRAGRVFFVDGTDGLDSNDGGDPGAPLATVTEALARCVLRAPADTYPIVVNKTHVHIIGLFLPTWFLRHPSLAATDAPVFELPLMDAMTEIANFDMSASGGFPCIDITTLTWGTWAWIHHCSFGAILSAQDGILCELATSDLAWSTIEHCLFGKGLTRDGIRITGNGTMTRTWIMNNIFKSYGGIGINHACVNAASRPGGFIGNKFFKEEAELAATGWAITITDAQGAMVDDNHAMSHTAAPGFNPYRDISATPAAGLNAWGLNYADITPTLPVIV